MHRIQDDIHDLKGSNQTFDDKFNNLFMALTELAENQKRMQNNMVSIQGNMATMEKNMAVI